MKIILLTLCVISFLGCNTQKGLKTNSISGIYPELACYNHEGECGIGAVVPWADRLWVITYGPHLPFGSSDKLYEITPGYKQIVRPESIGGTPANRLIHKESEQLFIGPYAINRQREVRVIPCQKAPGRYTGMARHLTTPENKIYIGTMEEGFYEVDVDSLEVKELYKDGNEVWRIYNKDKSGKRPQDLLPGAHGKGLYSGQGVMIYTNNGENSQAAMTQFDTQAGVLAEWDGKEWKTIRRNQFVEVTGPGGIYGNRQPATDPLWTTGWDHKSILLGVRDYKKGWAFYRLPKGSNSYDGAHGWNTEWPRIRDIGTETTPDYLMTMHGVFWKFPKDFTSSHSGGIQPRSAYLKVIGDFTRWNDQLVFGCDDSAQKEFLNKRKAKGGITGPGQSNSNLWFTSLSKPDELGPATAAGAVWEKEEVHAGQPSEPFLFSGWKERCGWVKNMGSHPVTFTFEIDKAGNNTWTPFKTITLQPNTSANLPFSQEDKGIWIRVKTDKDTKATVSFTYTTPDHRKKSSDPMFQGLASVNGDKSWGGLLYSLGNERRSLGLLANIQTKEGTEETGYYEMDEKFNLIRKTDTATARFIRTKFKIPTHSVVIEEASVLIVDDQGRRWRLPLGDKNYTPQTQEGALRICREVATERDLFNCHGTFYELPAENADGYAKIRPIASHKFKLNDYASYRGLLVLTGIIPCSTNRNEHIILSDDRRAAVWVGVIDDLWKLGKPVGQGGPWINTKVEAGIPSDPYLIGYYDKKELQLSHQATVPVNIKVEIDPTGNGDFMEYATFEVKPGNVFKYQFPSSFQGRWIRFTADHNTNVTAWLDYE